MKTTLLAALLGSAFLATPALAADDCACGDVGCAETACTCSSGMCGLHRPQAERPTFDAKTVVTLKGVVKELEKHPHGLHLRLAVGKELITAHLGPADFVAPTLTFAIGDAVEVTGSRVMFKGTATMLTTVVKKGTKSLELRRPDGAPRF